MNAVFQLGTKDHNLGVEILGGKGHHLNILSAEGFPVPRGFVIGASVLEEFIKFNHFIATSDIAVGKLPNALQEEILATYDKMYFDLVAVRSSANIEDSDKQSFAGQFDSFLGVKRDEIVEAVKKCWQSLYSSRALSYAQNKSDTGRMAVIVQDLIVPEVSGVAFSIHPITGDRNTMVIEAVFGSNEPLVLGVITPDCYIVSKDFEILDKKIVPQKEIYQQKLSDQQLLAVAQLTSNTSRLFNAEVDVEWAIEGGKLYILQSRPITAVQNANVKNTF